MLEYERLALPKAGFGMINESMTMIVFNPTNFSRFDDLT